MYILNSHSICIIFYPLYEDRYDGHMTNILRCWNDCINESHKVYLKLDWLTRHPQGRRSSLMRESISVRWSRVTMCSQRTAPRQRRALNQEDQLPLWTSLNPIENLAGIGTAVRKVQESENLLNDDDCKQFDASYDPLLYIWCKYIYILSLILILVLAAGVDPALWCVWLSWGSALQTETGSQLKS